MAEATNALIYQALVKLQGQTASVTDLMDDCGREVRAIQMALDGTKTNVQNVYGALANIDNHLMAIERRLGIAEVG